MDELFSDAAAQLARFPKIGKEGRVPRTRELPMHRNYMLVYELIDDVAWILSCVHTRHVNGLPTRDLISSPDGR